MLLKLVPYKHNPQIIIYTTPTMINRISTLHHLCYITVTASYTQRIHKTLADVNPIIL